MEKRKVEPSIRAVVFDLDGTLVDSLADIAAAVNQTLASHGRDPHTLESYKVMIGWGLKQLVASASAGQPFSDSELQTAYLEVLELYRANPVVQTRAYPGIGELLKRLGTRVPLGVFSNKEDGMTKTIVATLFPSAGFRSVVGAQAGKPHKPDPSSLLEILAGWRIEPAACAYLGDSDVDMETARRAGVVACGAAWGFRGEDELRGSGAQEVFTDAGAFGRWLEPRLS